MRLAKKLAALTGALAVVATGPGCAMFDEWCGDDCGPRSSSYMREGPPPPTARTTVGAPTAGAQPVGAAVQQPAEVTAGARQTPAAPGIYNEGDRR